MSFSASPDYYNNDELFLADCTDSQDPSYLENTYSKSFIPLSPLTIKTCGALAFYMYQSLLLRLLYNRAKIISAAKEKAFFKWRYLEKKNLEEDGLGCSKLEKFVKGLENALARLLKKKIAKWDCNAKINALVRKFAIRSKRLEEAQNSQISQISRVVSKLQEKKEESQKKTELGLAKEKKYREMIEELGRNGITSNGNSNNGDRNKYQEIVRKLEIQNENLKDKLEIVENNVNVFIREMNGALKKTNGHLSDDDGVDDFPLKILRKKKVSLIR